MSSSFQARRRGRLGRAEKTRAFEHDVHAEVTPQQKLMAKRAAQLDAYRMLAERILGLELAGTTTVRDQ